MIPSRPQSPGAGPGRRTLIGGGLASLAAAGAGVVVGRESLGDQSASSELSNSAQDSPVPAGELKYEFYADRQTGVAEEPQPYATLIALDLKDGAGREELQRLMRIWTDDSARLMSGAGPLTDQEPELAKRTSGLTITVGWGPTLFAKAELEEVQPTWAKPLPAFDKDSLDPAYVGGDLVLQIAAHSPMTVAHAQQELINGAETLVDIRWIQTGFREPMERNGWSMRNLFGQVDGTVQPVIDGMDSGLVWQEEGQEPGWDNATAMVIRRIAMDMASWERADRPARENAIGRDLSDGAPITGGGADANADLEATNDLGLRVINPAAHIRRAAAVEPHQRFLRRPYQFHESVGTQMQTGLIFIAFQTDPVRQFVPVQQRLDEADLLNIWTQAVGSALFAILPGVAPGGYLGEQFLEG
ncbi:Dyp-type peroxidase [Ornithinimicrobium sp. Arc0846-15]|nr:Dyp-type peroxidase [Ornithinimicrobium laminariae]